MGKTLATLASTTRLGPLVYPLQFFLEHHHYSELQSEVSREAHIMEFLQSCSVKMGRMTQRRCSTRHRLRMYRRREVGKKQTQFDPRISEKQTRRSDSGNFPFEMLIWEYLTDSSLNN